MWHTCKTIIRFCCRFTALDLDYIICRHKYHLYIKMCVAVLRQFSSLSLTPSQSHSQIDKSILNQWKNTSTCSNSMCGTIAGEMVQVPLQFKGRIRSNRTQIENPIGKKPSEHDMYIINQLRSMFNFSRKRARERKSGKAAANSVKPTCIQCVLI